MIGDALARHPKVRKISFTGGTTTGRHRPRGGGKLIPASLELGGKSPTIVLEDADIEQAARGICYGIFSSAGQACIAGSRLFIHESLYAPLMARLLELTRGLRVGHPFTDGVHVGPLINENIVRVYRRTLSWQSVKGPRAVRRRDPGRSHAGKRQLLPANDYRRAEQQRPCSAEEIFGPVLVAMPFPDETSLIREANDSVYGPPPGSGHAIPGAHCA